MPGFIAGRVDIASHGFAIGGPCFGQGVAIGVGGAAAVKGNGCIHCYQIRSPGNGRGRLVSNRNQFKRARITGGALRPRHAALVGREPFVLIAEAGEVDRRAARDQGMGLGRAAVVSQGGVEDVGQGGRCAVARGVEVVRAGGEVYEGIGIALAAVAEDVEGVGGDRAVVYRLR
jgi:hypothetical protein